MSEQTITADERGRGPADAAGVMSSRLIFIGVLDDLSASSSSHALDDLYEVRFRRGPRSAVRSHRVLTLTFPDARMSSEHGCWRRHATRWIVEDLGSKNGTVVDGEIVAKAVLHDGAVIELGHSFFVFRQSLVDAIPPQLAGDVDALDLPAWPAGFRTFSPGLSHAFATLVRLSRAAVSIVLLGETGTGKEIVARSIHELSQRPGELVAVNCGALPPTLIESELFGHRRGAFSGAVADRRGLVRSADQGTLFLDEIGELPPAAQATLLRVLQEREVLAVGDDRPVAVDLRVIAATLRALDGADPSVSFRSDLYARIAGHVTVLPPLRDRKEDLGLLLAAMLAKLAPARAVRLTPATLRTLLRYDWPRNLRELEQALATALALASDDVVEAELLPLAVRQSRAASVPEQPSGLDAADRELRATLIDLLARHDGNVAAVARALGKRRSQVYKWIRRLAIGLTAFRRSD